MTREAWLAIGTVAWAALLVALPVVALVRGRRARRATWPPALLPARRLVVRPCAGASPWLADALWSTGGAVGLTGASVWFTVDDPGDPAWPIASEVAMRLRAAGLDATAVVAAWPGTNRKAAQLVAAARSALDQGTEPRRLEIAVADADVCLDGVDLDLLCAGLSDPGVGATWKAVVENRGETPADAASSALLGASLHAFPLLGRLDGGGLVGKLFAFDAGRASAADALSAGLEVLGEDVALAAALRDRGLRVVQLAGAEVSVVRGRVPEAVLSRYTRWVHVVRSQRPGRLWCYPVLFLGPWGLAIGGAAACISAPVEGLAAIALAVLVRVFTGWVAVSLSGRTLAPSFVDLARADALLFRAWLGALRSSEVVWAGHRLRRQEGARWAPAPLAPMPPEGRP